MQTPEPEYVFRKGEGWVLYTGPEEIVVETSHGRYRIINRPPEMGERYGVFSKNSAPDAKYRNLDGTLNIRAFADYLKDGDIGYRHYAVRDYPLDNALYCTFLVEPRA